MDDKDILSQAEIDALMAGLDSEPTPPMEKKTMSRRKEITNTQIEEAVAAFRKELARRLDQKGMGTFVSSHEIIGCVGEEYDEAKQDVHDNDNHQLRKELLDIAVGAVFGVACIDSQNLDW